MKDRKSRNTPGGIASQAVVIGAAGEAVVGVAAGWSAAIGVAGMLALLVAGFHFFNSLIWRGRKYWRRRELRRPLSLELGVAGIVLLFVGWLDLNDGLRLVSILVTAGAALIVGFTYESLQIQIADKARDLNLESGTSKFAAMKPFRFWPVRCHATVAQFAGPDRSFFLLRWLHAAIEEDRRVTKRWANARAQQRRPPRGLQPSRMRRLVVSVMSAVLAMSAVALAGTVAFGPRHTIGGPGKSSGSVHKTTPKGSGSSASHVQSPGRNSQPPPVVVPVWDGSCPAPVASTAPTWARNVVWEAVEGRGAFGTKVDGCPGSFTSSTYKGVRVASAIGSNPITQAQLSLIVASDEYGATAYVAPAITPVERLLAKYHLIGGPPRLTTKPGDLYLIDTPQGSVVLIRNQVTDPNQADGVGQYQLLPPPVAALWLEAMRTFGSWLWPVIEYGPGRTMTVKLVVSPVRENVKYTITYDFADGVASDHDHSASLGLPIDIDELKSWANSIAR